MCDLPGCRAGEAWRTLPGNERFGPGGAPVLLLQRIGHELTDGRAADDPGPAGIWQKVLTRELMGQVPGQPGGFSWAVRARPLRMGSKDEGPGQYRNRRTPGETRAHRRTADSSAEVESLAAIACQVATEEKGPVRRAARGGPDRFHRPICRPHCTARRGFGRDGSDSVAIQSSLSTERQGPVLQPAFLKVDSQGRALPVWFQCAGEYVSSKHAYRAGFANNAQNACPDYRGQ
jgi:hypothetical protein